MGLRAIRGAIQVPANTAGDIAAGVQELISAILTANALTPSDVISVFFTSTVDLDAAFPAARVSGDGFCQRASHWFG
jgi:chorismate mutase